MPNSVKTVSLRELQAAVNQALAAAKKELPNIKSDAVVLPGSSDPTPIYIRFPYLCGLPPFPWPEKQLENLAAFNTRFVANLAKNPSLATAAANGKFQPALQFADGSAAMGFTPAEFSFLP
jgi:hypothetical protein